jgi:hypothetical protein
MTPMTSAQTLTRLQAEANHVGSATDPRIVTVVLKIKGSFNPDTLHTALDTQYATVESDRDTFAQGGPYEFTITP